MDKKTGQQKESYREGNHHIAVCRCNTGKRIQTPADDGADDTADVEPVEQRTVYVTPEWVKSVIDGNQAGYEDAVIAEVTYTGVLEDSESYKNCVSF